MASRGLKSLDGAALGIDRIEALRAAFRGQLVSGGDTDYETSRRIWNASIDRHPGVIARCASRSTPNWRPILHDADDLSDDLVW